MASNSLFSSTSPLLCWGESPMQCECVKVCVLHHALNLWDEAGPGSRPLFRTGGGGDRHGTAHVGRRCRTSKEKEIRKTLL